MTKCETAVVAEVKKSLKKLSGSQVIDTLWEMGLLSKKGVERLAIERSYKRLIQSGMPKCRAMDQVAFDFACSYEKIRSIIYKKQK
ncbi:MAG: hypothetical protein IKD41_02030 [Alistipes sp.]|nr:hypothetical protein [Alistipes sp.]